LAGTETLPIVQSGTTKQVSIANVTAGRAVDGLSFTATKVGNDAFIKVQNSGGGAAGAWLFADSVDLNYLGTVLQSAGVEKWFAGSYGTAAYQIKSGGRSGTEALRVETTNDVKVSVGNLVIGTSGKGISLPGGITWTSGSGSPEGVVTAPVGSLYSRSDGGALTSLYVKQSGSGNTGWVGK
jgi:hypothetical protein